MTLDDTEAVTRKFGRVEPVDPASIEHAVKRHPLLKAEFQEGDTLYHYDTTEGLAGDFGYLRVRNRKILGQYFVGMS